MSAQKTIDRLPGEVAREDALDVVVADAQRVRGDDSRTTPTATRAERRPPHPVDGQLLERVLDRVDRAGDPHRGEADDGAEHDVDRERRAARRRTRSGIAEDRRRADERDAHAGGGRARQGDGDERARPVLEEQQLDGEQHRRHRAAERWPPCPPRRRRRAASCARPRWSCRTCPTSEPSAPPVAMIGPSAPKGPPVPMAMAAESGLRNVMRGGDAALVEEHLLHRLGDAVAADGLRPVARHQADDDPPATGTSTTSEAEVVARRRGERRVDRGRRRRGS